MCSASGARPLLNNQHRPQTCPRLVCNGLRDGNMSAIMLPSFPQAQSQRRVRWEEQERQRREGRRCRIIVDSTSSPAGLHPPLSTSSSGSSSSEAGVIHIQADCTAAAACAYEPAPWQRLGAACAGQQDADPSSEQRIKALEAQLRQDRAVLQPRSMLHHDQGAIVKDTTSSQHTPTRPLHAASAPYLTNWKLQAQGTPPPGQTSLPSRRSPTCREARQERGKAGKEASRAREAAADTARAREAAATAESQLLAAMRQLSGLQSRITVR